MPFPTINACIICELARPELGGQFTLLGFHGLAPNVRVTVHNFDQPVQLCFVFMGGRGEGHFTVGLAITAPNGRRFEAQTIQGTLSPHKYASNFFMAFLGVLPGPGNYTASLLVNGTPTYDVPFALDTSTTMSPTPPPMTPPPSIH